MRRLPAARGMIRIHAARVPFTEVVMRRLFAMFVMIGAVLTAPPATARPSEVARLLPGAERVGAARFQVLTLPVFDAELWAVAGDFSWDRSFALSLTYRRAISGESLARRSVEEIARRQGVSRAALAPLEERFDACFADVRAGDRITGVSTGADTARFFKNERELCAIEWPGLRRAFFGVWLDGQGARRSFSQQLRGDS